MNWTTVLFSIIAVICSGLVAAWEGNFSRPQMRRHRGYGVEVFSFCQHWGMWSDLTILSVALGIMTKSSYTKQWHLIDVVGMLIISAVVTVAMHVIWAKQTKHYEHILGPDGSFTAAGLLHVLYMTSAHAAILLFLFATTNVTKADEVAVFIMLATHLLIANAGVGYSKNQKFDIPGVVGSIALVIVIAVAAIAR